MSKPLPLIMAVVLLIAAPAVQAAPPLTSQAQCRALCDQAAQAMARGDFPAALALLRPHGEMSDDEARILTMQYFSQREKILAEGEAVVDMRFMGLREAGGVLMRYNYLENFAKTTLLWQFTFYKPRDRWLLLQVRWSDDLDALFR